MPEPVETYLRDLMEVRRSGAATRETSCYGPLATLLNAVGRELKPKVRCIVQLANQGSGHPDLGLFTTDQFQRGSDATPLPGQKPSRGVIEAKAPSDDVRRTARTAQVRKYLDAYGLVLVTNFRDFLVVGRDPISGAARELESFSLSASEEAFWSEAAHPRRMAKAIGQRLTDFLRRALLHTAPLALPADVAWFLASYAREALARVEAADLPALNAVRAALEGSLGIRFADQRGEHFFRSTLVQTIFYGIFSSWILWSKEHSSGSSARFDWHGAAWHLRVPMISQLFEQVATPSRLEPLRLVEVLDWTATALNRVDRAAFFERFREEHAVQYFYEPFLQAFDPQLRKELGVWYTPPEVVRYMVGRVDQALRRDLGIRDGLADPRVHVLDPCAGTGAYLVEVLEKIAATLRENSGGTALDMVDVREAAKDRLHGFELLPAPFVVAHLQLGLVLQRLGVPLAGSERPGVYLTNALTGWQPPTEEGKRRLTQLELPLPGLREEREAAESVKRDTPILVILGNPPYNRYTGVAMDEEKDLTDAYREARRVAKPEGAGLNDLYVRFFRMAERKIVEDTGRGIVCFISNYSWLDGLSYTGMRERYLEVFDRVTVDCLNGDKYKTGKVTPEGEPDPSVFSTELNREGIQVGTAIAMLVRRAGHEDVPSIEFRHFWGKSKREDLVAALDDDSGYATVEPPVALGLPFFPTVTEADYLTWPTLPELFPAMFPGISTARDSFVVDIDFRKLEERISAYFSHDVSDEEMRRICEQAMRSVGGFDAVASRRHLQHRGVLGGNFIHFAYRPFDIRWLYWEPETKLLDRERPEFRLQVFDGNSWIVCQQRPRRQWSPPQLTRQIGCLDLLDRGASFFPLLLQPDKADGDMFADSAPSEPKPNLSPEAAVYLSAVGSDHEALFFHAIAVLHAPDYREENAGALRQDWPRVPLPATSAALEESAQLGREVAALLDPEASVPGVTTGRIREELRPFGPFTLPEGHELNEAEDFAVTARWGHAGRGGITMPARGDLRERKEGVPEALRPLLGERAHDVMLNGTACWANVPEHVWEYTLGGYQVVKKWLSYREHELFGRPLRLEEVRHVEQMVRRIAALLLLGPRLDANYQAVKRDAFNWEAGRAAASRGR